MKTNIKQTIKDAIRLVRNSRTTCAFSTLKKPTRRILILEELVNFIKINHISCQYDADGKCWMCDIKI